MKTLACHLDERSAQLKREALGRIQVALAGAPPNSFYRLLQTTFGYKMGSALPPAEDISDDEDAVPSKKAVPSTSVGSVATAKRPMSRKPFTAMPSFDVDPKTSTASPEANKCNGIQTWQAFQEMVSYRIGDGIPALVVSWGRINIIVLSPDVILFLPRNSTQQLRMYTITST